MPIFKVRATERTTTTWEFYVEAENERDADGYAAGIANLEDVPGTMCVGEEAEGGEIEAVDGVKRAPDGARVLKVEWRGAFAYVPPLPDEVCHGGQKLTTEPCPKCGATMDDGCRAASA